MTRYAQRYVLSTSGEKGNEKSNSCENAEMRNQSSANACSLLIHACARQLQESIMYEPPCAAIPGERCPCICTRPAHHSGHHDQGLHSHASRIGLPATYLDDRNPCPNDLCLSQASPGPPARRASTACRPEISVAASYFPSGLEHSSGAGAPQQHHRRTRAHLLRPPLWFPPASVGILLPVEAAC